MQLVRRENQKNRVDDWRLNRALHVRVCSPPETRGGGDTRGKEDEDEDEGEEGLRGGVGGRGKGKGRGEERRGEGREENGMRGEGGARGKHLDVDGALGPLPLADVGQLLAPLVGTVGSGQELAPLLDLEVLPGPVRKHRMREGLGDQGRVEGGKGRNMVTWRP